MSLPRVLCAAAPATLALLQERCESVAKELIASDKKLQEAGDVVSLRRAAIKYVLATTQQVDAILAGSPAVDPGAYGMTTEEERTTTISSNVRLALRCLLPSSCMQPCRLLAPLPPAGARCCHYPPDHLNQTPPHLHPRVQWPGVASTTVRPPNASLRLFGGAAFERCLQEFAAAAHALEFPTLPRDKVANLLLAYSSRNGSGGVAKAAEELARTAAREALGPLLDTACARLGAVVKRAYDIAAEQTQLQRGAGTLRPYVAFHAALRSAFQSFMHGLEVSHWKPVQSSGKGQFKPAMP